MANAFLRLQDPSYSWKTDESDLDNKVSTAFNLFGLMLK